MHHHQSLYYYYIIIVWCGGVKKVTNRPRDVKTASIIFVERCSFVLTHEK